MEIHAVKFVCESHQCSFYYEKNKCVTINGHLFRWCMWVLDGWGRRRHYAIPTQIRGDAISTKYIIIPVNSIFISIIIAHKPLVVTKVYFHFVRMFAWVHVSVVHVLALQRVWAWLKVNLCASQMLSKWVAKFEGLVCVCVCVAKLDLSQRGVYKLVTVSVI